MSSHAEPTGLLAGEGPGGGVDSVPGGHGELDGEGLEPRSYGGSGDRGTCAEPGEDSQNAPRRRRG